MGIRKSQQDLTATERRAFIDAVLQLKRRGEYDEFVRIHNDFIMSDRDNGVRTGHRSPSFLPWHRQFLLDFERALQRVDLNVSLPYWDWTVNRRPNSPIWNADFMGGNGRVGDRQVMNGPFAFSSGNWTLTVRVDDRPFLRRVLAGNNLQLPTAAERDTVLAINVYDSAPWNSTSATGFRNQVEGWRGPNLHNRVHVWVGGTMATGVSPNDPVFWLHHCYIDRLWADWQARHPNSGYLPGEGTADVVDLNDTMTPWGNIRPADLLDHTRWYTYA